jgi:demethylmenaquinone methyltransferase/2-methoxy-6-polyprenyl-1,4-benzoquinol methylase
MPDPSHGARIEAMFNRISRRYDLLNRLISFGQDRRWRRYAVSLLGNLKNKTALDLCCGSGDFLDTLLKRRNCDRLYGVDFAADMLELARRRFNVADDRLLFCRADALRLPFHDTSVDAVTIGFGIRNIADREAALAEIRRVLRSSGRLVMIEPAVPSRLFIRTAFLAYFEHLVPLIGGLLSGDRHAYRYLHDSSRAFPSPDEFCRLMTRIGYAQVKAIPQTFGAAMIYYGEKP